MFSASSNSVSVLLRALQEKRRLEVLSRPQLMALDGQPGYVQVGQNVPRDRGDEHRRRSADRRIRSRTEAVGLILQVVPRISPDGLVVMQITANKSEVGPEAEGIPISVSDQRPGAAGPADRDHASAHDGQRAERPDGGPGRLAHKRARATSTAACRSSPTFRCIGDLFRYDSVSEERRELLIILTPQIIYNKMDSDLVKQIESSRMSWILSDVINLHGEAGLRSRCDEWYDGEMESVYPNVVPEEGVLPLSRGQLTPGGGPELCAPMYEQAIPGAPATTTPNGESLPQPNVRQSPTSNRPINDRYTAIETSGNATPAVYQEPPSQPFPAATFR